ncbi:MAG: alpha-amylase [Granulosicoccus sp.]|nr:alpha-amylase [Granulosicoccus sp.]
MKGAAFRQRNSHLLTASAQTCLESASVSLEQTLASLQPRDQQLFRLRLARWFQNLYDGLWPVYGQRADFNAFIGRLVQLMATYYVKRPDELKTLDLERDLEPDWFQHESMLGYVFYVEQFAGRLDKVQDHLDYLQEMGVNYLHLMKVMQSRDGENDGGYAVTDYRQVDSALGTNAELQTLCSDLRERGVSVCIDLVLNHCAREHPWALAAQAGDEHYQQYFYLFEDRTLPDAYERTLPEVFPEFAPGNFTYDENCRRWVWTTFNHFQWDLNWSNPEIFLEIVEIMLDLANLGIEVFRLDAVAFMWKRLGTDSQNQEEVFDLMQALRTCSRIATPAVAHKAEAIVAPDDLIRYFGVGRHHGKVSNIAYHNSLMVQFWSSLASRDTRLMTRALSEFPRTPNSIAWGTYIRCHDDIGWAVADDDADSVGLNGPAHRQFLSSFYAGEFTGSFARGGIFQFNEATGDRRINGTLASLAGLEQAIEWGNTELIDLAIERILLAHALICGFGGLPLIYMGDELGLLNDRAYDRVADHANDSRWMHRPPMDWDRVANRHDATTIEGRLYGGFMRIVQTRRKTAQLNARYDTDILNTGHPHLFTIANRHPLGTLACVYNFSEHTQWLNVQPLYDSGVVELFDRLTAQEINVTDDAIELPPYARLWLS